MNFVHGNEFTGVAEDYPSHIFITEMRGSQGLASDLSWVKFYEIQSLTYPPVSTSTVRSITVDNRDIFRVTQPGNNQPFTVDISEERPVFYTLITTSDVDANGQPVCEVEVSFTTIWPEMTGQPDTEYVSIS